MSWLKFPYRGGLVKVKPRWQLRSVEETGRVPSVRLWFLVVSWWDRATLEEYGQLPARWKSAPRDER